jgi:rhamnosyl/mannosyltransferase
MKLLEINKFYHPWIGGVEKVVQDIAEGLNNQDGLTVEVLACQTRGKRSEENINGVKVRRAASFGKKLGMPLSLDFFRWLLAIENDYDALLFHFPFPLAALAVPFLKNKKIFIWYHSDIVRQKISGRIFRPFIRLSLKRADKILVSSQGLIDGSPLLKKYRAKCEIIYFGLDLKIFSPSEEIKAKAGKIREQYGAPLLLSVGRLVYYKGFRYLLAAMPKINAHLIISGEGAQETELRSLIKLYNLEKKVSIIKPVLDLRPYYEACDLFVFPSCANSEAFGLVQMEAMAFSRPVVNTNLPTGVKEVSLDRISGLTVPPKDPAALAKAINEILANPELKKGFGEKARSRVENIFDRDIFKRRVKEVLLRPAA